MKKSAFSLIELSIVILIIGILVAGVTQSSRLISKMRLASARSQTQSSDVASVKNTVFWLETTSEKSFDDAATEDDVNINSTTTNYSWYDINNQISQKSNASSATLGADYEVSGINNLPCLNFNGSTEFMDITQTSGTSSQLSVFIVFRNLTLPSGTPQALISIKDLDHTAANNSFHINIINTSNVVQYDYFNGAGTAVTTAVTAAITANTPYLVDVIDDGTTTQTISLNSATAMVRVAVSGTSGSKNLNAGFNIGSWDSLAAARARYFNGDIAEVILFDRALKAEERNAIEKYLGKKWGIKSY